LPNSLPPSIISVSYVRLREEHILSRYLILFFHRILKAVSR
jgi:hypothetical protein